MACKSTTLCSRHACCLPKRTGFHEWITIFIKVSCLNFEWYNFWKLWILISQFFKRRLFQATYLKGGGMKIRRCTPILGEGGCTWPLAPPLPLATGLQCTVALFMLVGLFKMFYSFHSFFSPHTGLPLLGG